MTAQAETQPSSGNATVPRIPLQVWVDEFPVVSETFVVNEVRELQVLGHAVQVVAGSRPERPMRGAGDLDVRYLGSEPRRERAVALARLVATHPLRCLRDLIARRRWRREESVVPLRVLAPAVHALASRPGARAHAHFAAGAALGAMRASALAGRPWSLTAHAYDIYKLPRNLPEKVAGADLVTSGCDYTVRDLRAIAGPHRAHRVQRIVMGVHAERFTRTRAHPQRRVVVAVGRLVEKKGFVHLVRAAALPPLRDVLDELVIVGDGPLRAELEAEAAARGVQGVVRFAGRREPDEIGELLEEAAVLAMPCVVAADGDRDSMPVVVKEAMAMEVPVVVSDEVGLPELVRDTFGRTVPPRDEPALAAAVAELLALPADRRAAMGRAARDFVVEHADVRRETARLSALLAAGADPGAEPA